MTFFDRPRDSVRAAALLALALSASTALAACSSEAETPADTAAEQSPAPVLGEYDDRIQLVEGTPYALLTGSGDTVSLEITGHDDGDTSNVVLSVTPEEGQGEEITLAHGDVVELDEASWRVSEMGFSDSMPGSVTLTREE